MLEDDGLPKSKSPIEKAERLSQKLIERYSEGDEKDERKVRLVKESLALIRKCEPSLRNTPNGFCFMVKDLEVNVNPRQKQCVSITQAGKVISNGPFRDLSRLIDAATVISSRCFCSRCSKEHRIYGMEIEMNHLRNQRSSEYRSVVLRRLNNKYEINQSRDMFGIDGGSGGGPTEIRNIEGNSVDELIENLTSCLGKFKDALEWAKKDLVGFRDEGGVRGCGIHIHMFHKGIPREKVLIAHSVTSLIVNTFDTDNFRARIASSYGVPFANRQAEWCQSEFATELRCLNTTHPEVLRFAMIKFEDILTREFKMTPGELISFCEGSLNCSLNDATIESPELLVAFFVNKGVLTEEEAAEMIDWMNKNYKGVDDILCAK